MFFVCLFVFSFEINLVFLAATISISREFFLLVLKFVEFYVKITPVIMKIEHGIKFFGKFVVKSISCLKEPSSYLHRWSNVNLFLFFVLFVVYIIKKFLNIVKRGKKFLLRPNYPLGQNKGWFKMYCSRSVFRT